MTKWIRNRNGILIPNREAGFIQPGIGLLNKKGGGGGSGAYFDPTHLGTGLSLSNGNSTVTSSGGGWNSVRSVTSHNSGKVYAECLIVNVPGSGTIMFGMGVSTTPLGSYPGNNSTSWGDQGTNTGGARTWHSASSIIYNSNFVSNGGYIRIAMDISAGLLFFGDSYSGGRWLASGTPDGGSPSYSIPANTTYYIFLGINGSGSTVTLKNNTGENSMPIPNGYSMWN